MNCITVRKLLNEYVENNLTNDVMSAMSLHILECKECATEEKLLRLLVSALHSMPRRSASQSFTEVVMASLPELDENLSEESLSKADSDERSVLSVIAYRSGAKPTWDLVRGFTRSMGFVKYVPRPTIKLRIGEERTRSLTKMPFAFGFRW